MTIPSPSPGQVLVDPPNTAPSSLLPRLAPVRIHLQSDVNGREENNMATPIEEIATERRWAAVISCAALIVLAASLSRAGAQEAKILKNDAQIDGRDPGVRLFVREKMTEGNTRFTDKYFVLFLHGVTAPSTCDLYLAHKDYSWADWMAKRGYFVFIGDYRNYVYSTREKAMEEPAAKNQPVTRSYLALRDIEAMVEHIKRTRGVQKVTL